MSVIVEVTAMWKSYNHFIYRRDLFIYAVLSIRINAYANNEQNLLPKHENSHT
jgi:hypothetical protein